MLIPFPKIAFSVLTSFFVVAFGEGFFVVVWLGFLGFFSCVCEFGF